MADIKTHLRELSVATVLGLLKNNLRFHLEDLYSSQMFWQLASQVIDSDISNASNICDVQNYTGELRQIVDNGCQLATYIYNNPHFSITTKDPIYWLGNDTQKEDPADIAVGRYGFSLKEESFILENMGLYKLLNCYTGSRYTRRHIFKDYAPFLGKVTDCQNDYIYFTTKDTIIQIDIKDILKVSIAEELDYE